MPGSSRLFRRSVSFGFPDAAMDVTLMRVAATLVLVRLWVVVRGSTPSVSWTLEQRQDRSVAAAGSLVSETTTNEAEGQLVSVGVPLELDSWLVFRTSAVTGTVQELALTAEFVEVS